MKRFLKVIVKVVLCTAWFLLVAGAGWVLSLNSSRVEDVPLERPYLYAAYAVIGISAAVVLYKILKGIQWRTPAGRTLDWVRRIVKGVADLVRRGWRKLGSETAPIWTRIAPRLKRRRVIIWMIVVGSLLIASLVLRTSVWLVAIVLALAIGLSALRRSGRWMKKKSNALTVQITAARENRAQARKQAEDAGTDPDSKDLEPACDWLVVKRNFLTMACWRSLLWVLCLFCLLWIPMTLWRGLWEYITSPAWRDSIFWLVRPSWWWIATAVAFWVLTVLETDNEFSFLLPSQDYQEDFPHYQILLFWGIVIGSALCLPYLLAAPFHSWALSVAIWVLWASVHLIAWGYSIPTGRGACVLFFERPFQDRHSPGLTFFFNLNALSRIFRSDTLFKVFMVLPIDTEDHDPDEEKKLLFRMVLSGRLTQATGYFTFRWRIHAFGKFLRRVKPEDMVAAAREFTVPRYQELVELIWGALETAVDRFSADMSEGERARRALTKVLSSDKPAFDSAREAAEHAESQAIEAYRVQVETKIQEGVARYGVRIRLFMGWDFPKEYARAQAESAAKGAEARGDARVYRTVAQTVAGKDRRGRPKKPGLLARGVGAWAMLKRIGAEGGEKGGKK